MPSKLPKRFIFFFIILISLVWIFLFKDFLNGTIIINIDSFANYGIFKYFYNNLFNGVIPLWEPLVYLGRPSILFAPHGALNILVFLTFLLHFIGINYYQLYLIYLITYLFLGIFGFFILSKIIFQNDSYTLIAVCFLMFSGLPAMLFNQVYFIMLFVPALWFFVFLLKFFDRFRTRDFWGIICSLMVVAVSYYPFYFICLIFSFLTLFLVLFPNIFLKSFKKLLYFIKSHQLLSSMGAFFVLIAFIPLLLFKTTNSTGEILSPARHICTVVENCPKQVEMSYEEIALAGTFGERFAGGRLFSHLDKFNYNQDNFIYVTSFIFIVLLMAMFTIIDRKRLIILGTICAILVISLGGATPVYKWLFDHIFFFKYFRNLFFFAAFLIPLTILFAVAQLKSVMEQLLVTKSKGMSLILVVLGHILFCGLLILQGNIISMTYLTVLLSLIFFVLLLFGFFQKQAWLLFPFLFVLIFVEPIQVFISYRNHTGAPAFKMPQNHEIPQFQYTRPSEDSIGKSAYAMDAQLATFKDASGLVSFQPDFLNSYVFDFYRTVPADEQKQYAQNKIVIYDRPPEKDNTNNPLINILQDSQEFKILYFDVNSLTFKTHFLSQKFLVYHDAYSIFWKAFVNGKEIPIQLTQKAFKGVNIPAGENIITFRYMPPGGQGAYVLVLVTMFVAFCMLGIFYFKTFPEKDKCC